MDPRHGRQCRDGADKRKQSRNAGLINEFGASCEPFDRSMGYQMKFHEGPLHRAIFRLSFDAQKRLHLSAQRQGSRRLPEAVSELRAMFASMYTPPFY